MKQKIIILAIAVVSIFTAYGMEPTEKRERPAKRLFIKYNNSYMLPCSYCPKRFSGTDKDTVRSTYLNHLKVAHALKELEHSSSQRSKRIKVSDDQTEDIWFDISDSSSTEEKDLSEKEQEIALLLASLAALINQAH